MSSNASAPTRYGRNPAVLFALGSMTSIQVGSALSPPFFAKVGPSGVVWLRLMIAGLMMLTFVRPRLSGHGRRDLISAIALGVASGAVTLAFFEAIARIPLGITVAIEFLGPLSVALAGSRRPLDALWILLAAGGIGLLTLGHPVRGGLDPTGVTLAFVAAAAWGTYIVLTKRVGKTWPGIEGLAVSLAVAALVTTPFGLAHGIIQYADVSLLAGGLGLALLVPLVPYILEFAALRRLPTRVFGVLMSLEPAIGALAGLLILGQTLALGGVAAILLIIIASLGATLTGRWLDASPVLVD